MTEVGVMIEKVGFRPTKEWVESTYKVELEDPEENQAPPASIEAEPETVEEDVPEEDVAPDKQPDGGGEDDTGDEKLDALIKELLG
jgi:hypothetical protein